MYKTENKFGRLPERPKSIKAGHLWYKKYNVAKYECANIKNKNKINEKNGKE